MAILIACVPLDIDIDVLGGGVTVGGATDDGAVGGATAMVITVAGGTNIMVAVGGAMHMGITVAGGTDISADIVDITEVGTGIVVEVMETVEIIMNYC